MLQRYIALNGKWKNWLWVLVAIGILVSLPLIYERIQTERSTKNVEIVFDYRDLLEASAYRPNPDDYIQQHLTKLKEAGVGSMAVYESSLNELELSRRLQVYNAQEYGLLTGAVAPLHDNYTYLLFANREAQERIQPILEEAFRTRLGVSVYPWSHKGRQGLVIELPFEEANTKPLQPDPITMDMLQEHGFRLIVRLSNRIQPFVPEEVESWLKAFSQRGIKRIVFDGVAVTGYDEDPENNQTKLMAELMVKYNMGTALIERLKVQQFGMTESFLERLDYNVVRLFSLFDTEARMRPEEIADKLVLGVKDRNMRILFLNIAAMRDTEKGYIKDSLDNIYDSLTGPGKAIERIQKAGYRIDEAHAFVVHGKTLEPVKPVLLASGAALIALTIGLFFPVLAIAAFVLGLIGIAGLYVLSHSLALQAMAFGVSVCAPTLATIMAIRWIGRKVRDQKKLGWGKSVLAFLGTTVVTGIGVLYIVGLLSDITYYLVLQQFRGVTLLHLMPILLVGAYALIFAEASGLQEVWQRLRAILMAKITVLWVVLAAVFGGIVLYYLTRTGNEGQASQLELAFRAFLENELGVRPRLKEFAIAHPLFILAVYLYARYRHAIYLFAGAVMGQLSIVDTFAHLHTPLYISLIRVLYGMAFGIVISLVFVAVWELLAKGWRRWVPR